MWLETTPAGLWLCDTSLSAERAVPRRAVDDVGRLAMLFENFELLRTIVPFFRVQLQALYSAENPHSSECLACVPESHSVQLLLTRNCTLSFRKITRGFTVSPKVYSVGFSAPSRRRVPRRRSDVGRVLPMAKVPPSFCHRCCMGGS